MPTWNIYSIVKAVDRGVGLMNFSPSMQCAILLTHKSISRQEHPVECADHTPLKSCDSDFVRATEPIQGSYGNYHACNTEIYAVVDTGCQRSAIGRNTLNKISMHLPSLLRNVIVLQALVEKPSPTK